MSPRSKASCTSWIVEPGTRSPTDHFAPGRSWPCMASIQRTAAAGSPKALPSTRWAAKRRRATRWVVITWTWWQTCRRTPCRNPLPGIRQPPDAGGIGRLLWTIPAQCASRHVVALGDKRGGARGM